MGYFKVVNPEVGKEAYEEKPLEKYLEDENTNYWDDPKNYYKQNWIWFGTALYLSLRGGGICGDAAISILCRIIVI